jgi:hypothetical protein
MNVMPRHVFCFPQLQKTPAPVGYADNFRHQKTPLAFGLPSLYKIR